MASIGGKTDNWGSRFGFIMAAVGSAVGLGNMWRFPYEAGTNGGGAFVLIYLGCILLLGLPVLMAEYAIGRKGDRSAVAGIRHIAEQEGKSTAWQLMGVVGAIASLAIFSFYIVISAWVFDYIPQAISGAFTGITSAESGANFGETISNPVRVLSFLGIFLGLNVLIVARGVSGGIEKAATFLMPLFFIMLMGMVIFAMINGDPVAAATFLFQPDFSQVQFSTFLSAVGQAFFSLGVGSCLMITYGAYLRRDTDIPGSSGLVVISDTMVALIAGLAIFPIVFGFGLDPAAGPGLFFVTMPVAFGAMGPIGVYVATAFFTLALFAAFTSSISLFEVGVSWMEDIPGVGRVKGAIGLGILFFIGGILYVNYGSAIDYVDFVSGKILLPLGGLLIAIFAGWILARPSLADELGGGFAFTFARTMLRYVIPPALTFILIFGTLDSLQNDFGLQLPDMLVGLLGENT